MKQEDTVPQLHLYVPDSIAGLVRQRARSQRKTVSSYLADIVCREVAGGWPAGYFDDVVGGWSGRPLRRPPQGRAERREEL
ncbi:MAG: hypothetical protein U0599_19465 [Vicinamibacteria bacterium]